MLSLWIVLGEDETSMDGITVSAIDINVVHCEGVSTSPSGAGGRGLAKGAMKPTCWLVISWCICRSSTRMIRRMTG